MSNKDLKLEPYDLDDSAWWYEDTKGIDLHVENVCPSGQRDHRSYLIPWKVIRAALERKERKD